MPPRRRLPRQIPPYRIEADYGAALIRLLRPLHAAYAPLLRAVESGDLDPEPAPPRADRLDAADRAARARALLATAVKHAKAAVTDDAVAALARKFSVRTATYQRVQLARQVHAALGTDPVLSEDLGSVRDKFVRENVSLIKRIGERQHAKIAEMVTEAVDSAKMHPSLKDRIRDRFGVSDRHAKVIARDQISKHHAKLNTHRQKALGIKKFVWRTVEDERVRDEHDELDGETYSYDDPPTNSTTGEQILPGDDVQCRCSADPVFD